MIYELQSVAFGYGGGDNVIIADGISISPGEVFILSGPVGSGKTTFLRLLQGTLRPTKGKVLFRGQDMTKMKAAKMRLMMQISGIIDQNPMLVNELTVFENIALPLQLIGFNKEMINKACLEIMALFGINYLRSKTASDISLAEARLVTLARALVKEPQIILADDPTSGLDESTTLALFDTFSKAADRGTTVIIASSDKMLRTYFRNAVSAELINGKVTLL